LDPFAGCGTALVAANARSWNAVGYEAHPVFARIGRAKACGWSQTEHLEEIACSLIRGFAEPIGPTVLGESAHLFLSKLFDPDTLATLLGARTALQQDGYDSDDLAFLVLSKIVDMCSHSQTDGVYKAPSSRKVPEDPRTACHKVVRMIHDDMRLARWLKAGASKLVSASSETMPDLADKSVEVVVTSPPYLNNFDYAEMTRMVLYFWGMANCWADITRTVRSKLIVNTTTALRGHKERQQEYRLSIPTPAVPNLDAAVRLLREERRTRAGKKEYDLLVYPYFSQMTSVLRECARVLRPGALAHVMVADAALYGVHISTPQLLATIMEGVGFHDIGVSLVRKRGERWILNKRDGSKEGLGEYHIRARK